MVPLLFFGMMIGIAYHQELALLLTAELTLIVCFTLGQGLDEYVVMLSRRGDIDPSARSDSHT